MVPGGFHRSQEAVVEFPGRVMSHTPEFLIKGRHFHESGEITAWSDGNGDMRDRNAEDLISISV
jgi:hypothetical protein